AAGGLPRARPGRVRPVPLARLARPRARVPDREPRRPAAAGLRRCRAAPRRLLSDRLDPGFRPRVRAPPVRRGRGLAIAPRAFGARRPLLPSRGARTVRAPLALRREGVGVFAPRLSGSLAARRLVAREAL